MMYMIIFMVGIIAGVLTRRIPTPVKRNRPRKRRYRDVNIDDMMLWGEVTNNPFYKGK